MTEFSTTAVIEAKLDRNSVSRIESQLEDVGPIQVGADVSASQHLADTANGSQSAMSGALDATNQHLNTIRDHGSELIDLAQERNHILRENLQANELSAQSGGGGGDLPTRLLGGGLGLLGGLTLALSSVDWAGIVTGAIEKIGVAVGDLIKEGGRATVDAADLVADKAEVEANHIIDEAADVGPEDVIDGTLAVGDLVKEDLPIGVGTVLATTPLVTAADVVSDEAFPISVGQILAASPLVALTNILPKDIFPLDLGNFLNTDAFPIDVSDLIKQAQGESQGASSDTGSSSGTSGQTQESESTDGAGVPEAAAAGISAFGLNALLSGSSGGLSIGGIAGRSVGVTSPLLTRSMIPSDEDGNMVGSQFPAEDGKKTNREVIVDWVGGAVGADAPGPQPGKKTIAPGARDSLQRNNGGYSGFSEEDLEEARGAPDYYDAPEGRSGTARERSAVSYPNESSRGTPDRNETNVEADVTNEVETTVDISNMRELEKFLRDPERYIEKNLDISGGR